MMGIVTAGAFASVGGAVAWASGMMATKDRKHVREEGCELAFVAVMLAAAIAAARYL